MAPANFSLMLAIGLLALAAVNTGSLWIACQTMKLANGTVWRCLVNVLVLSIAQAGILLVLGILFGGFGSLWGALVMFAVAGLIVPWVAIRMLHQTTWRKAAISTWILVTGWVALVLVPSFFGLALFAKSFVVPTGAMATAIYGYHARIDCDNCGYQFSASLSERITQEDHSLLEWAKTAFCPNCTQKRLINSETPTHSGDRISTETISHPKRWDIVVFRYPENPNVDYVMRLVGLPGETLVIREGDVFADGERLQKMPNENDELWIPVYDSKFVPKKKLANDWVRDSDNWQRTRDGGWRFQAVDRHQLVFDREITSVLAYNAGAEYLPFHEGNDIFFVGDIRVDCQLDKLEGGGEFGFTWQFRGGTATASVTDTGACRLEVSAEESANGAVTKTASMDTKDNLLLSFCVRDGIAYLLANEKVLMSLPVGTSQLGPVVDFPPARTESVHVTLFAEDCVCEVSRIQIFRDVYYLDQLEAVSDLSMMGTRSSPAQLGAQDYFVLGDNSAQSKDSRFWGFVPEGHIKSVVRARYWPHYRLSLFEQYD